MSITLEMLSPEEHGCAMRLVAALFALPVALPRIEAICREVASARPMISFGTQRFGQLTRRERHIAVSLLLAAFTSLDDEASAERVIQFLGQPHSITTVLNAARKQPLRLLISAAS